MVISLSSAVSFIARVYNVYRYIPSTISFVDGLAYISLTLNNVIAIFNFSVKYPDDITKTLSQIMEVQKTFSSPYKAKRRKRRFFYEFSFWNMYVTFFYVYDTWFWISSMGVVDFLNYGSASFQNYLGFIIVMTMRYMILSLEFAFRNLNASLRNLRMKVNRPKFEKHIANISKAYTLLCGHVDTYNNLFGVCVTFVMVQKACDLLYTFMICINYFFMPGKNMDGVKFGPTMFVLCFLWLIKDFVSAHLND